MSLYDYPVLTIQPHFASPPKLKGTRQFDTVSLSQAPQVRSFRGLHAQHTLVFDFQLHGLEEVKALSDFFYDRKGKWDEFFVLSWHAEAVPAASLASGATALSVEPMDYTEFFAADPSETEQVVENLGHYIFLLHEEGDLHLTQVRVVASGDPEVLHLVTPPERDFELGRFVVGFLYFVRFLTDELELEYSGPESASASLAMVELVAYETTAVDPLFGDPTDDFEAYDEWDDLLSLDEGEFWSAAYVSRSEPADPTDPFAGYSAGADLGGLKLGVEWAAPYVSRGSFEPLDTFDGYSAGAGLNGLDGGQDWEGEVYLSRPS